MLDIGWSELLVIAVVMIVIVGPKDLPKMLRAFGKATARMRSTANEFKKQFDDALREAELDDVKAVIDETRKLDPRKSMTKVFEPIRTAGDDLRSSLEQTAKPKSGTSDEQKNDVPSSVAPAADSAQDNVKEEETNNQQANLTDVEKSGEELTSSFTISDPEPAKPRNAAAAKKKATVDKPSGQKAGARPKEAKAEVKTAAKSGAAKAPISAKPKAKSAAKTTPIEKPAKATSKTKTAKETETKA